MCGIVGYVGSRKAQPLLISGLKRLEYRGYDSAGIALLTEGGLMVAKSAGKIVRLEETLGDRDYDCTQGIAHTRWATHGEPTELNAHPHTDDKGEIALVHNGIIENYRTLREFLIRQGFDIKTETDTEILVHLIRFNYKGSLTEAVRVALTQVDGTYGIAVISSLHPGVLVVARMGSPLVIGDGDGENFVASDVSAMLEHTNRVVYLEDGEIATITSDDYNITTIQNVKITHQIQEISWTLDQIEKEGYEHFMLKEIHEQPGAVSETLQALLPHGAVPSLAHLGLPREELGRFENVRLLACGTSLHAGLVGRFYLERLARIPCQVEYASEFRYREPLVGPSSLVVGISQSGETADTIAAMRLAAEMGGHVVAISNVRGSHATRLAQATLLSHAGPEIGVASTKAFTTQLVALLALALALREARGLGDGDGLLERLRGLPYDLQNALDGAPQVAAVAEEVQHATNALYLGRGVLYPLALEGALKLKEISYLHAEGYPAGEMKHGPIALLDESFPVIALCPAGELAEKVRSNVEEVRARRAPVYVIGDANDERLQELAEAVIPLAPLPWPLLPVVAAVPLQLLAYEVAVRRGCDVDQPRNLAKSVTVE
jgi:glucosamine--fructose-6-phosphate aminotransferase (isomerizing)